MNSLRHSEFWDLGSRTPEDTNGSFPIMLLADILVKARLRLQRLVFNGVCLTGTRDSCHAFARVLETLLCLRSCEFSYNSVLFVDTEVINIDPVVMALSRLPLAHEVKLQTYCWHEEGYPLQMESAAPLYALFSSSTIQELSLGSFHLGNLGLNDVGHALKNNTTLKKLQIDFESSCPCTSTKALSTIADALSVNTSLEILNLELVEQCPSLDTFLEDVAQALTKNPLSSLVKFKVQAPCTYGVTVEKAFVQMLETANYTLEKVEILSVLSEEDRDDDEDDDDVTSAALGSQQPVVQTEPVLAPQSAGATQVFADQFALCDTGKVGGYLCDHYP